MKDRHAEIIKNSGCKPAIEYPCSHYDVNDSDPLGESAPKADSSGSPQVSTSGSAHTVNSYGLHSLPNVILAFVI